MGKSSDRANKPNAKLLSAKTHASGCPKQKGGSVAGDCCDSDDRDFDYLVKKDAGC